MLGPRTGRFQNPVFPYLSLFNSSILESQYQTMLKLLKLLTSNTPTTPYIHSPAPLLHFHPFSTSPSTPYSTPGDVKVAIFWEVDNEFRKSYYPFDAAIRLRGVAKRFGFVKYKLAYATRHAWSVENLEEGVFNYVPNSCKVCGRRFSEFGKLLHHFKDVHERENLKRVRKIESAKGKKRESLVEMYAMKMKKFKYGAREILNMRNGFSLAKELERGGFWVKEVGGECRGRDCSLSNHIKGLMVRKSVGCVVLVSADPCYVEVLEEAKLRGLKTVVIGDDDRGALGRIADASFSWDVIMRGEVKVEDVSGVGKGKDCDVLKGRKTDGEKIYPKIESDVESVEFSSDEEDEDYAFVQKGNAGAWWKLNSDATTNPDISQAGERD